MRRLSLTFLSALCLAGLVVQGTVLPDPAEATSSIPSTTEGIGERRFFTFEEQSLTDRMVAKVNVANGNLLLTATDLEIAGTGLDARVERSFNSLSTDAETGGFGPGWATNAAPTVRLEFPTSTQVTFVGPSGYRVRFDKNPTTGAYVRAVPGIDARLSYDSGTSTYRLLWNSKELHVFSSAGRLLREEDKQGNQITYAYDGSGRPASVTETHGRTVSFAYNAQGLISQVTDAAGGRTYAYGYAQFAGDPTWRLATSKVTGYGLGSDSVNVGAATSYSYDADGRLVQVVNARGDATAVTYLAGTRKVASITRVTAATTAPDPTTSFTYHADATGCGTAGSPVKRTVVDGPRTDVTDTTTYCADAHDRVVATIDAKGHQRTSSYTSNSNVASFNESGGTPTYGYSWNTDDNLTQITLPTGGAARALYGDTGNRNFPTSVFDYANAATTADAATWAYDYDTRGNLIEAKNTAAGVTYRYCYTGKGLLQRIDAPPVTVALDESTTAGCGTAGQGNDTLFTHDAAGNLTQVDPPGPNGSQSFTYDAVSRVKTATDGRGVVATYTYDALDHVTKVTYTGGPGGLGGTGTVDYTYDAAGNNTYIDDSVTGINHFTFDELNRTIEISTDTPYWETQYTYDTAGNMVEFDGSNEPDVFYTYDNLNRVTTVKDQKGRTTSFGYNTRDLRTSTSYPNGVTEKAAYDDSRRLACVYGYTGTAPAVGANGCPSPSTSLLTYFGYTYTNPTGRDTTTRHTETTRTGDVTTYSYDPLVRLTRARTTTSGGGSELRDYEYTLEARGNITRETVTGTTVPNTTTTLAYNDANELCWTATGTPTSSCGSTPTGATSYSYDAAGNLASNSAGLSAGYTLAGQTAQVTPPGGTAFTMAYAGATSDDRRQAGTLQTSTTLLGLTSQGPATSGTHSDWFTRDPHGKLVAMINRTDASKDLYYLHDGLGSVAATTNTTGTVANRYTYEPYGEQLTPNPATVDTNGDPLDRNPFRYASGYYDTKTGMLKYGTRYYMPNLMRWTQPDPVMGNPANPMSLNPYTYVGCDPVNAVDPSGRQYLGCALSSLGLAAGTATVAAGLLGTLPTAGLSNFATIAGLAGLGVSVIGFRETCGELLF